MTGSSHAGGAVSNIGGNEGLSNTGGPRRGATVAPARVPSPRRVIDLGVGGEGGAGLVGGGITRADWVSVGSLPGVDGLNLRTLATSSIEYTANISRHTSSLGNSTAALIPGVSKAGTVKSGSSPTAGGHKSSPRVSSGHRASRVLADYTYKTVRASCEGCACDAKRGSDVSSMQLRNSAATHSIALSSHGHSHVHPNGRGGGRTSGGRTGTGRSALLQERKDSVGSMAGSRGKHEGKGMQNEDTEGGGLTQNSSSRNSTGACRGLIQKEGNRSSSASAGKLGSKRASKRNAGSSLKSQDPSQSDNVDSDSVSTDSYVSLTPISVPVRRKLRPERGGEHGEKNSREGNRRLGLPMLKALPAMHWEKQMVVSRTQAGNLVGQRETKERNRRLSMDEVEMRANHLHLQAGLAGQACGAFQSKGEGRTEPDIEEDMQEKQQGRFSMPLHWKSSLVGGVDYEEDDDDVLVEASYDGDSGELIGRSRITDAADSCMTWKGLQEQAVLEETSGEEPHVEVAVDPHGLGRSPEDEETGMGHREMPGLDSIQRSKEDMRVCDDGAVGTPPPKRYEACDPSEQVDICEEHRGSEFGRDAFVRDIGVDVGIAEAKVPRNVDGASGEDVWEVIDGPSLRFVAPELHEMGVVWVDTNSMVCEIPIDDKRDFACTIIKPFEKAVSREASKQGSQEGRELLVGKYDSADKAVGREDEQESAQLRLEAEAGAEYDCFAIEDNSLEMRSKRVIGKDDEAVIRDHEKSLAKQVGELNHESVEEDKVRDTQVECDVGNLGAKTSQYADSCATHESKDSRMVAASSASDPILQGLVHADGDVDASSGMKWGKMNLDCNGGCAVVESILSHSALPLGLGHALHGFGGHEDEYVRLGRLSQGIQEGGIIATVCDICHDHEDDSSDEDKDEEDDGDDADCDSDEGGHTANYDYGQELGTKKEEFADGESDDDLGDCRRADGNSHGHNPLVECGPLEECQKDGTDGIPAKEPAKEQPSAIREAEMRYAGEGSVEVKKVDGAQQPADKLSGSFVRLIRRSMDMRGVSFVELDEVEGGYHADHENAVCDPSHTFLADRSEEGSRQVVESDGKAKEGVDDNTWEVKDRSWTAVQQPPHVEGKGEYEGGETPLDMIGECTVKYVKPAPGSHNATGIPNQGDWLKYHASNYGVLRFEEGNCGERPLFGGCGINDVAAADAVEGMLRARGVQGHCFKYTDIDIRARVQKISAYQSPFGGRDARWNGRGKAGKSLSGVFMWEEKREKRETDISEVEMMKERFAKLLLGEDMSGGSKGVCTALAISNAITNLSASVFGQLWELAPLSPERKTKWRREMEWLLCVSDYIVELVPSQTKNPDGSMTEVMVCQQRGDLHANLPALRQLDSMLLETLDSFAEKDFWYIQPGPSPECDRSMAGSYNKWWLPEVVVAPGGLPEESRKKLHQKRDCTSQILKAAMAINTQVLSEMEVPEAYWEQLPKSGKVALGDVLYRAITADAFTPEGLLAHIDLSNEHSAVEMASQLEIAMHIWRRRRFWGVGGYKGRGTERVAGRNMQVDWSQGMNLRKDGRVLGSAQEKIGSMLALGGLAGDRRERLADRAEASLLVLRQKRPGLPQTLLDSYKIQYNKDVGQSLLESYSRVLESLASNIKSRIKDVLLANNLMTGVGHSPRSRYLSFSCNLMYPPVPNHKPEHIEHLSNLMGQSPSTPSSHPSSTGVSGSLSTLSSPATINAPFGSLSSFSSSLSSSSPPHVNVHHSHTSVGSALRRSHRRWFSTNGKLVKSVGSLGGSSGGSSGGCISMGSMSGTLDHVDAPHVLSEDYLPCDQRHGGAIIVPISDDKHNHTLELAGPHDEECEEGTFKVIDRRDDTLDAKPLGGADKPAQSCDPRTGKDGAAIRKFKATQHEAVETEGTKGHGGVSVEYRGDGYSLQAQQEGSPDNLIVGPVPSVTSLPCDTDPSYSQSSDVQHGTLRRTQSCSADVWSACPGSLRRTRSSSIDIPVACPLDADHGMAVNNTITCLEVSNSSPANVGRTTTTTSPFAASDSSSSSTSSNAAHLPGFCKSLVPRSCIESDCNGLRSSELRRGDYFPM